MVEVIEKDVSLTVVCGRCHDRLRYEMLDVVTVRPEIVNEFVYPFNYIKCPTCGNMVVVHEWRNNND